jgi:hypothetical protein
MRYLIGALCAVAILFGAAPSVANAATVGCGRVTTFVAPDSAGALRNSDGWVIFLKPDGSSEKVILRAGTQVGTLSGYVCVGIDGVYFTGLLAPGTADYIVEPLEWLPADSIVYCGIIAANSITSGQGSGSGLRTYELRVTSGPAASGPAGGRGPFFVPDSIPLPVLGSYVCGRFARGVPMMALVAVLRAGDPGYVAAGSLPGTSTSAPTSSSLPPLAALGATLLAVFVVFGLRRERIRTQRAGTNDRMKRTGGLSCVI